MASGIGADSRISDDPVSPCTGITVDSGIGLLPQIDTPGPQSDVEVSHCSRGLRAVFACGKDRYEPLTQSLVSPRYSVVVRWAAACSVGGLAVLGLLAAAAYVLAAPMRAPQQAAQHGSSGVHDMVVEPQPVAEASAGHAQAASGPEPPSWVRTAVAKEAHHQSAAGARQGASQHRGGLGATSECGAGCGGPALADPLLTAYWDVGDCGPVGNDHNSHWCGGHTKEPLCDEEVDVSYAICASGSARLLFVNTSARTWYGALRPVYMGGCGFMYVAHYKCTPTTTTTTTTISTTSTTTSTSSSTTTVTTTTTTTYEPEAMFWERLKTRWPDTPGFSCAEHCPDCKTSFVRPEPPQLSTDLNGVRLPDVCIEKQGAHTVFVIGDWGGILGPKGPAPADHRKPDKFPVHARKFVVGVDDCAQQRVAQQMAIRAAKMNPDYVLNMGDNFYWAVDGVCGQPLNFEATTKQFRYAFEEIYHGPGLDGKPWLGVLGNHDYGGYKFNAAWDQVISYTWGPSGRWLTPAQYWRVKVHYPGFAVDYFFADTNKFDAEAPPLNPGHNLCNNVHNPPGTNCGRQGPTSIDDCPGWFQRLWDEQTAWLEEGLGGSTADWQIIVTHFPPRWGMEFWQDLSSRHGIDLMICGHSHNQELHHLLDENFMRPTAWLVSGGGGGITSEGTPDPAGNDDEYGFMELTLAKEEILMKGFTHGGQVRWSSVLQKRHRAQARPAEV